MRKGFTLIELLIVIIIIGVLAAIAIPQYITAVERSKLGKAKSNMGLLTQAEKMYRADKDMYCATSTGSLQTNLGSYVEMTQVDNDRDYGYGVTSAATDTFLITATRNGTNAPTSYKNGVITLNQDGVCHATGAAMQGISGADCQ